MEQSKPVPFKGENSFLSYRWGFDRSSTSHYRKVSFGILKKALLLVQKQDEHRLIFGEKHQNRVQRERGFVMPPQWKGVKNRTLVQREKGQDHGFLGGPGAKTTTSKATRHRGLLGEKPSFRVPLRRAGKRSLYRSRIKQAQSGSCGGRGGESTKCDKKDGTTFFKGSGAARTSRLDYEGGKREVNFHSRQCGIRCRERKSAF